MLLRIAQNLGRQHLVMWVTHRWCICREARPVDLEAIKALKESMRQRDDKLEGLSRKIDDLELSRQQLQEEMHLREKNWLANGNIRVGPGLDGAQGTASKPPARKSASLPGR